jgi:hypothetical protein
MARITTGVAWVRGWRDDPADEDIGLRAEQHEADETERRQAPSSPPQPVDVSAWRAYGRDGLVDREV